MINYTDLQIKIIYLKNEDRSNTEVAEELGCDASYVGKVFKSYKNMTSESTSDEQGEFNLEVARLMKQNQALKDKRRVEGKIRDRLRLENAISEYTKELIKVAKEQSFNIKVQRHPVVNDKSTGIFQLSDLHLNELISLPHNKFDYKVAAKRLQKYVSEAMRIFDAYKITEVLVALTGDLMNSDRRLDEMLNMATNRAKASILITLLLEQVILDLASKYNVKVASVSGNESRVKDEFGSSEAMLSYNYDYNIFEILKLIFRNSSIEFINSDPAEQVICLNGQNVLLIHGNQLKGDQTQSIQKIVGKYANFGVKVNFVIFGHLHEARIGDYYARSSSLCGANAYSDNELQLVSRASQNIHIVQESGVNSMKIDLQNALEYSGYEIRRQLMEYNAKSHDKVVRLRVPKI